MARSPVVPRWRCVGAVLLVAWTGFLVHFSPLAVGSDRFVLLALETATGHGVSLDRYSDATRELAYASGHAYLDTNPGLPWLAAPAVWCALRLLGAEDDALYPPGSVVYVAAHFAGLALTSALASAVAAAIAFAVVEEITSSAGLGLLAAGLYAFGSIAFFFSTRLQQNVVIGAIAAMVWVILRRPGPVPARAAAGVGLLLGCAVVIDLSAIPVAIAVLLAVLPEERSWRTLIEVGAGAALPVLALLGYQAHAFGHLLWPAQAYIPRAQSVHATHWLGLALPSTERLLYVLLSREGGLLAFMPWVVAAFLPVGAGPRLASPGRERRFTWTLAVGFFLWTLILPSYRFAIFGARYLIPVLPLAACAAVLRLAAWPRTVTAAMLAGAIVNVSGAQLGTPTRDVLVTVVLWVLRGPWLPSVEWLRSLGESGPAIVTPYGILLAWAIASGAVLWRAGLLPSGSARIEP